MRRFSSKWIKNDVVWLMICEENMTHMIILVGGFLDVSCYIMFKGELSRFGMPTSIWPRRSTASSSRFLPCWMSLILQWGRELWLSGSCCTSRSCLLASCWVPRDCVHSLQIVWRQSSWRSPFCLLIAKLTPLCLHVDKDFSRSCKRYNCWCRSSSPLFSGSAIWYVAAPGTGEQLTQVQVFKVFLKKSFCCLFMCWTTWMARTSTYAL